MTESLHNEVRQRRQIYNHIKNLETECENLKKTVVNLTDRLEKLNNDVDKMIEEKQASKRAEMNLKNIDALSYHHSDRQQQHHFRKQILPKSSSTGLIQTKSHGDLNYNLTHQKTPSDAFKLKLSLCLQEISSKADDIYNLSQQL